MRQKINIVSLDDIILRYANNKAEFDSYKKLCDTDNAKIKELMLAEDISERQVEGYKATCTVSQRETMKEDILISMFTSVPAFIALAEEYNIVKQKPYVDFDALEKVIYDGKLSNEQLLELDKAKESKDVVTLRISKVKNKGEK